MTTMSYAAFERQALQHYQDKEYAEMLALVEREGGQFPDFVENRKPYWEMCILSLLGRHDDALTRFDEALQRGVWFSEQMLRRDDDLASLQGQAQFEALVARSLSYQRGAQAASTPALMTFVPRATATSPLPLLLALHGNNNSAAGQAAYWQPPARDGWVVAVAQSSQVTVDPKKFIWDDEAQSEAELLAHLASLQRAYDIDPARIVMGGFSMGGRLALKLGLTGALPVTGIVALGAYLQRLLPDLLPHLDAVRARGVKIYQLIGDQDHGCYADVVTLTERLREHQIACELRVYPGMGHDYPPDFAEALLEAVRWVTR
jgi:predicted esterase